MSWYRRTPSHNLYPADAVLNLPVHRHLHGLRRLAALESVRGSFAEVTTAIERQCGVGLGKRQVEELAQAAAEDVDAFYAAARPGPREASWALVLSVDGKGIVMRPQALRAQTARAARITPHQLGSRLSPGRSWAASGWPRSARCMTVCRWCAPGVSCLLWCAARCCLIRMGVGDLHRLAVVAVE